MFEDLKFETSAEPIKRKAGRNRVPVPGNIVSMVKGAIKTGLTTEVTIPTLKCATFRRFVKLAVTDEGNYVLKTQEVPGEGGNSKFKFSVHAAPQE